MTRIQKRQPLRVTIVIFVIAGFAFSLMAGCEKGPTAPTAAEIVEIVKALTTCETTEEAEAAIRSLIDKVGLGVPAAGSNYEIYALSDEEVSEFAQFLLDFLAGKIAVNMGQTFGLLKENLPVELPCDFDEAISSLQQQVSAALVAPEDPNNVLLIAMIAEGTTLPETVPVLSSETVLSPVQMLLFGAWTINEFIYKEVLSKVVERVASVHRIICEAKHAWCCAKAVIKCTRAEFLLVCFKEEGRKCYEAFERCLHEQGEGE